MSKRERGHFTPAGAVNNNTRKKSKKSTANIITNDMTTEKKNKDKDHRQRVPGEDSRDR